jgi:hypothetical protein
MAVASAAMSPKPLKTNVRVRDWPVTTMGTATAMPSGDAGFHGPGAATRRFRRQRTGDNDPLGQLSGGVSDPSDTLSDARYSAPVSAPTSRALGGGTVGASHSAMRCLTTLTILCSFFFATTMTRSAHAEHQLAFMDPTHRNWSQESDTLYVNVDKADLAQKTQGASHVWLILSARSATPEFWTASNNGTPEFTERCILKKDYDFTWIEATEIPLASAKGEQFKVTNAVGAYYAFVVVQKASGALVDVNITKLGAADRNPPRPGAVEIRNPQTLSRTWDDDKRYLCGQRNASAPVAPPAEPPMVHPLPFMDTANRNWSTESDAIYLTLDKADLTAKLKDAKRAFVVVSARMLMEAWWADVPRFTATCVLNKKYDFNWIEATEVPIAKLGAGQVKVTNALGTYYAFLVVEYGDGRLADVKLTKLGDNVRNPPIANAVEVRNGPKLVRGTWDDDKKPLCK